MNLIQTTTKLIKASAKFLPWLFMRTLIQYLRVPMKLNYRFARFLSRPLNLLSVSERVAINQGLTHVYGNQLSNEAKTHIVSKTFEHTLKDFVDKFYYPLMSKEFCSSHVAVEGRQYLDDALKQKKGVVLLHSHLGNPHWIMPVIGHMGYKLHQIASRKMPDKETKWPKNWIYEMQLYRAKKELEFKETFPVQFIYTDAFLRKMFNVLKKNEILAIGLDGREGTDPIEMDFLNNRAIFYTGMMRFLLRTQPVILPCFHVRKKDHHQAIIIEKPMHLEQTGNKEQDIRTNIATYLHYLESYFYKYPWLYAEAFAKPFEYFLFHKTDRIK